MTTEVKNIIVTIVADHKPDGVSTMSARWNLTTGVWIRYNRETSHREAWRILADGIWDAIQDPDGHDISQDERGPMTVAPYWDGTL